MKPTTLFMVFFTLSFPATAQHPHKPQPTGEMESVQIFRTGCHGRCPTYSVEINRSGIVTYIAVRFCPDTGTFNKNIGTAKAMEILNKVNSYRPDTCKDVYPNHAADLPGLIYTIKYKNKIKNIRNARWGPNFLSLLSKDIDAAGKKSDNIGWKKVMPPTKR
jgi:uncharacterized protein DUF6438